MKLVLVQWDDTFSATGHWTDRDDLSQVHVENAVSVGILFKEDEKNITVCTNLSGNQYSQTITIPKGCIKQMWKLGVR